MKILGAILIIVSCGVYGLEFYKKSLKNLKYTQGLINGFEFMRSEMSFSQSVISDIFIKSADFAGAAATFFDKIGNETNIEGVSLSIAFSKCASLLKSNTNKDVFNITSNTVLQLGISDTQNQIKLLESSVEKLKKSLKQQNSFCEKEGVMCKKLGFVIGMAISLLLL